MKIFFLSVSIFCFILQPLLAQEKTPSSENDNDFFGMSLEELLSVEVEVASQKSVSLKETPAVVTVITEEFIKNMGARSLIDILQQVPGFQFAGEVDAVIGLGVRGNWGSEGKVLILLDGLEMNETSYGSFSFGNHIPLDQISKIEIIRGPGSAIYGGLAELAVINIITKSGEETNGATASVGYGTNNRHNIQLSYGKKLNDWDVVLSASESQCRLNNNDFTNECALPIYYSDSSGVKSMNVNLGLKHASGLDLRVIYDKYEAQVPDWLYKRWSDGIYVGTKYAIETNDKLTIIPKFNFKSQKPWNYNKDYTNLNTINKKYTGGISALYEASEKINISLGTEYYDLTSEKEFDVDTFSNGSRSLNYNNLAVYAEGVFSTKIANFTAGARFINHSVIDGTFVPRFGITRATDKYHLKLMYNKAFKTPLPENFDRLPNVKPELTSVLEFEGGIKIGSGMAVTINLFDISISDPIVYNLDFSYSNYGVTGSRGAEFDYKIKGKWGFANLAYSFYMVNKNKINTYSVPTNSDEKAGFAQNSFSFNSNIKIGQKISFNPSAIFLGGRSTYMYTDEDYNYGAVRFKSTLTLNAYVKVKNIITDGLEFGIGVYDIGNVNSEFLIPYESEWNRISNTGRELIAKISYAFN